MRYDFSQSLVNFDGETLKDEKQRDITLGSLCANALVYPEQNNAEDIADKCRAYELAMRIVKGGTHDVSPEEVALVRRKLAIAYTALAAGQAAKMLDNPLPQA